MTIRVLYVTPFAPSMMSGGGRHCYANLRSLSELADGLVGYVGPTVEEHLPGLENVQILVGRRYRLRDKIAAALSGAATSAFGLFRDWKRAEFPGIDVAFVETTRLGAIVRELAGGPATVCCVHNVEADFMRDRRGLARLAALNVRRSELETLKVCDHLLVMHRHDLSRLQYAYGVKDLERRAVLHPACATETLGVLTYALRKRRMVIPGSLGQPYNAKGIHAFLEVCWPSLRGRGHDLVVAGRNPGASLRDHVKRAGATLLENPASMAEIVRDARVVLVPDLGGAGMKLRVAEALSLGVPVVGTREGLLGYEQIDECGRSATSIAGMGTAIRQIIDNEVEGEKLATRAREVWQERYSFNAFSERVRLWFPKWLHGRSQTREN